MQTRSVYAECKFDGCDKPLIIRGYCQGHYKQLNLGKPLTPLRSPGRSASGNCELAGCSDAMDSMLLCSRHYAQRAKTTLTSQEFIAGFAAQQGVCPYCLESLGTRFEIDHYHGDCEHPRSKRMCRECMRGMIHRECNEELKWVERAVAAGRGGTLAPHVAAYLAVRPFLVSKAA